MTDTAHKLTIADATLLQDSTQDTTNKRIVTAPDEAVSRLLEGEEVWVTSALVPAVTRTLTLLLKRPVRLIP